MSEKKIVVPEGMLNAGRATYSGYVTAEKGARQIIEAALRWLSENPVVPNYEETIALCKVYETRTDCSYHQSIRDVAIEWQRRMFLAPEPEVPEAVKDLLIDDSYTVGWESYNARLLEAYRRGQKEGSR